MYQSVPAGANPPGLRKLLPKFYYPGDYVDHMTIYVEDLHTRQAHYRHLQIWRVRFQIISWFAMSMLVSYAACSRVRGYVYACTNEITVSTQALLSIIGVSIYYLGIHEVFRQAGDARRGCCEGFPSAPSRSSSHYNTSIKPFIHTSLFFTRQITSNDFTLRRLYRAQIFWNCAYYVMVFQQCGSVIQRDDAIGRMLHYAKNTLFSPCTSLHYMNKKIKQTFAKLPDYIHKWLWFCIIV